MEPKDRLIVALDYSTPSDAEALVNDLGDVCGFFKVGFELFVWAGLPFVHKLKTFYQKKVFLDLKIRDIPNTIERVMVPFGVYGVDCATIYAHSRMIQHAYAGRKKVFQLTNQNKPAILAVRELSSMAEREVPSAELIEECVRAGADGFVASGHEVRRIRETLDTLIYSRTTIVAPGIRPHWSDDDDHKHVLTPKQAIQDGADYIVVGRPIQKGGIDAARRIIDEIASARSR